MPCIRNLTVKSITNQNLIRRVFLLWAYEPIYFNFFFLYVELEEVRCFGSSGLKGKNIPWEKPSVAGLKYQSHACRAITSTIRIGRTASDSSEKVDKDLVRVKPFS